MRANRNKSWSRFVAIQVLFQLEFNEKMKIEVVDGKDEKWISKKRETLNKYGLSHKSSDISGEKRFNNNEELKLKLGWLNKTSPPGDTFIHTSYSDLQNFRTFHRNPGNCSEIA